MRHRVGTLIGDAVEGLPWLGTFHSIAAKILRIHAELVGLKSSFTILDTDDQIRLLKQVEKVNTHESFKFADGKGQKIYEIYQARLKVLNACDFGDLLLHNLTLFMENPDILKRYHAKFKFMLVDEYLRRW